VNATLKTAQSLDPASYLPDLYWKHKTRPDGRIFSQARPTSVAVSVLQKNAIGSAIVTMKSSPVVMDGADESSDDINTNATQSTLVLAGVTADVGQPSSRAGDLRVTLVPSNPALESWLQRLLVACLDLDQLGIVPGKAAFGLDVTVAILNFDGNLRDSCLLAAVAALTDTMLPAIVVHDGRVFTLPDNDSVRKVPQSLKSFPSKKLVLGRIPISLSMGSIHISCKMDSDDNISDGEMDCTIERKHYWLVDPAKEEESVCEGGISVVVNGLNPEQILSLDYTGRVSTTSTDVALALRMAQGRVEEFLPLLAPSTS